MRIINVAVVGVGYWGPNLVRNFLKIPNVHVAYICDINKGSLDKISVQYPHINRTTDYNVILKDKTINLVAIATPISTHFNLCKKALIAEKHVFVEKPITMSSKDARSLMILAKCHKRMLMVGHTFIYSSAIKIIKKYIKEKKLGDVYYYDSIRINLGGFQKDTNVLWDLASHDLAILSYILPERPVSVYVVASSYIRKEFEDVAHVFVKYTNDIFAHIHVSWLSPVKIRTILLGGSKKMILYNDIEPSEKVKIYNKKDNIPFSQISPFTPAYRSGDVIIPRLSQQETMHTQLLHAVNCIHKNINPITDGMQGLRVVEMLEALEKSLKSKKEIFLNDL